MSNEEERCDCTYTWDNSDHGYMDCQSLPNCRFNGGETIRAAPHLTKLPHIEGLETALMNAVKPSDQTEKYGEWVLWCGMEHHADAILQAAKAYLDRMK